MNKHKQKQKLARKLSGRQSRHFDSSEWDTHRDQIASKVIKREARQKEMAKKKREKNEL